MIQFKSIDNKFEWQWILLRARPLTSEDTEGIVAYDDKTNKILGAVVMDSWTKAGPQCHIAIDNPMCIKAGLLHRAFYYIHIFKNRPYAFGLVPSNNTKALKFDKKIGFEEVACVPDGYDEGIDYIILRIKRENNRWITKDLAQKEVA